MGVGKDLVALHEADELPAQLRRGVDVGQVVDAVDAHLDQAVVGLGDGGEVVALELAELLEVVLRLLAVDQHGAAALHQHEEAGLAEADLLGHVGEGLERHVHRHHPGEGAGLVLEALEHRDVHRVVRLPVVAVAARQGEVGVLADVVPGPLARVPVAVVTGTRPLHIGAVGVAHVDVAEGGVVVADAGEVVEHLLLAATIGGGDLAGLALLAEVVAQLAAGGVAQRRVVGQRGDGVADRVEEGDEGVVDQPHIQAAGLVEVGLGLLRHVADGQQRDDQHGDQGRHQKTGQQFALDAHGGSVSCYLGELAQRLI